MNNLIPFQQDNREKWIPNEWVLSLLLLIFKKGDTKEPGNYRGID